MAFVGNKILLGFEDEPVSEKFQDQVDFSTNKVGGVPNWISNSIPPVSCKLCGLSLPLVLQVYAPMKNSSFHRTLYIFACVNPKCWNESDSWVCLRDQKLDTRCINHVENVKEPSNDSSYWLNGSDSWGDEENGNIFSEVTGGNMAEISKGLSEMSVDDGNANFDLIAGAGCVGDGAVGTAGSVAVAMIEGDEGEVVCVETPTSPSDNLVHLMEQAMALPQVPDTKLEFCSFFISVDEEDLCKVGIGNGRVSLPSGATVNLTNAGSADKGDMDDEVSCSGEQYEKSLPAHGDKMFHQFLTRIQANPGQIIRYGGYPLWLYPEEKAAASICKYCGGPAAFEMQILPTLIPRLILGGSSGHLEFGSAYVFCCLSSCWDQGSLQPRFESVVVQREKL